MLALNKDLFIKHIPHKDHPLDASFIPLNETAIRQYLGHFPNEMIDFHLFNEIDSTNRFLKDLPRNKAINICCAEKQTQGRGRFGRHWLSPFGENIYFSGRWTLHCCLSKLSGLSLVISIAIINSLQKNNIHQDIMIKWPNDLLWNHKKLCGVLVEIISETNNAAEVIIGIGINVNMLCQELSLPNKACSLYEITGHFFDRNVLIAELIITLDDFLKQFLQNGFKIFQQKWQQLDYLAGQHITVHQPHNSLSGDACGVNLQGELCLKDKHGEIYFLSSGETSLAIPHGV